MKLPKKLIEERDKLAERYVSLSSPELTLVSMKWDYRNGFDAGAQAVLKEVQGLVEALEQCRDESGQAWIQHIVERALKKWKEDRGE